MKDIAVTVDVQQLIAEEGERTRSHIEALVARIETRLLGMERTGKIALTEIRSLATKVDRLTRP